MSASVTVNPARVLDRTIDALNSPGTQPPLADLEMALRAAPYDARLWHVKGLIYRDDDRRELAIPALQRAVELAPNEPLIAHGYARTLLEAGLPAVDAFARATKLAPNDPEVIKGLAAALAAQSRTQDAISGLEQVLRRSPLWTDGHVLLANLRWSNGERRGFTRSYADALAVHPNSLELRRQQLVALLEAEHFDDAMALIDEGRRLFGDHVLFASHEAAIRSESGDLEGAERLFTRLAALDFANIEVWHVRHLLRSGRPDEASRLMDRWIGTPDQDLFWPYVATAWHMADDPRSEWLERDGQFVRTYDIEDRLPPLDGLAEVLRKLHVSKSEFFSQSVRGGTQTDGHLFQRIEPEIVATRDAVRQAVADYAAALPTLDAAHPLLRSRPRAIQFAGAWSVRLLAGGQHSNHTHPYGWVSSALYVVVPSSLGPDGEGWLKLGEPPAQLNVDAAPVQMIQPIAGRLALFPSWMWHGTRPFGEGERITIAFDVAPVD